MTRVGGKRQGCFSGAPHQKGVNDSLILEGDFCDAGRQSKNHVKIWDIQDLSFARLKP